MMTWRLWGKETRSALRPAHSPACRPAVRLTWCGLDTAWRSWPGSRPVIYEGDVSVKPWRSLGRQRGAALHQKWVVVTSHLFGVESHGVVRPGGSIKWAAVG